LLPQLAASHSFRSNMIVFVLFSILSTLLAVYAAPIPSLPAEFVVAHNAIRAAHVAPPLSWSDDLAAKAASWVDQCHFRHTGGVLSDTPYGELHVAATGNFSVVDAVQTFVQDESDYNPRHPTLNHFTQVVWSSTTQLGCARATCQDLFGSGPKRPQPDATYYVCLYDPPGNVAGDAPENVHF
jgi:pathogenesis-related protein 1